LGREPTNLDFALLAEEEQKRIEILNLSILADVNASPKSPNTAAG
jgi:hypothetical protein